MSRVARRTLLARAYILHTHPFRDTSRILEVFTREQGRVSVFARGVRGPKARLASLLQPFQPLLISFTSHGDAGQLISAAPETALAVLSFSGLATIAGRWKLAMTPESSGIRPRPKISLGPDRPLRLRLERR